MILARNRLANYILVGGLLSAVLLLGYAIPIQNTASPTTPHQILTKQEPGSPSSTKSSHTVFTTVAQPSSAASRANERAQPKPTGSDNIQSPPPESTSPDVVASPPVIAPPVTTQPCASCPETNAAEVTCPDYCAPYYPPGDCGSCGGTGYGIRPYHMCPMCAE